MKLRVFLPLLTTLDEAVAKWYYYRNCPHTDRAAAAARYRSCSLEMKIFAFLLPWHRDKSFCSSTVMNSLELYYFVYLSFHSNIARATAIKTRSKNDSHTVALHNHFHEKECFALAVRTKKRKIRKTQKRVENTDARDGTRARHTHVEYHFVGR